MLTKLGRREYGVNEDETGYGDDDNESQQEAALTAGSLAVGELDNPRHGKMLT